MSNPFINRPMELCTGYTPKFCKKLHPIGYKINELGAPLKDEVRQCGKKSFAE